jgi:tripartite-type tricarboxylate transporter receptor subunit TctC
MARLTRLMGGAILVSLSIGAAPSQEWPTRPVTMVVPFAAGGPADTVGRILAPGLSELLGQQVIIENVGGSGGMTGSYRVAKATPDGYQFVPMPQIRRSIKRRSTMPQPISHLSC